MDKKCKKWCTRPKNWVSTTNFSSLSALFLSALSISLSPPLSLSVFYSLSVFLSVSICLSLCLSLSVSVSLSFSPSLFVCLFLSLSLCLFLSVWLPVSPPVSLSPSLPLYIMFVVLPWSPLIWRRVYKEKLGHHIRGRFQVIYQVCVSFVAHTEIVSGLWVIWVCIRAASTIGCGSKVSRDFKHCVFCIETTCFTSPV